MTAAAPLASTTVDPLVPLAQRLRAAADALGVPVEEGDGDLSTSTSLLYSALVDRVHAERGTDALWLLMTALAATMPDADELVAARRARELRDVPDFEAWLLEATFRPGASRGSLGSEMDVVCDAVLVDVDFTAQNRLHTGIQRVVRETLPHWVRDHRPVLVAWTAEDGAMRHLSDKETDRVVRWHRLASDAAQTEVTGPPEHRLVVPWRCTVVLPEIPAPEHCSLLAALARFSGSSVSLVGHDCIPVISPDLIHEGLADRFTRFLETVKHADRVVGVSASAAREFRGYVGMLAAQGLTGPSVATCPLPVEVPPAEVVAPADPPLVVCVGSFEPRKNQLAVLHAAERLWREGLDFQLRLIGFAGWVTEADALMHRLQEARRPVTRMTEVSDADLWRALRSARFSVFVSLHEGFGLPVAESLACGTPCLTTAYGSTRETAEQGGALLVDPEDDEAVADQMRRLLTDDDLVARLRREAAARPRRTWTDYAQEAWAGLVPGAEEPR